MSKFIQILEFSEIRLEDLSCVGSIGANLGEMYNNNFPVPRGFVIPSSAYKQFLQENDLEVKIKTILKSVNHNNAKELQSSSENIRNLILKSQVSEDIQLEVNKMYRLMGGIFSKPVVAVRSSTTSEDKPKISFVGQQESFLNVQGNTNVLLSIRKCWASVFTPPAIFYREEKGFNHFKVGLAVIIQEMIQSEVSGVAFTMDPTTQDKTKIVIEAIWGLGEMFVQGNETPDKYELDRHSLQILNIQKNSQNKELVKNGTKTSIKRVPIHRKGKQKLSEDKIKELAKILQKIHSHYFFPQDIEWAYKKGKFYIIQTRPITTISDQFLSANPKVEISETNETREILLSGAPASPGIVTGEVRIIKKIKDLIKIKKGNILVTVSISPDFIPVMKRAAAIVTDMGGVTSHAAIVARELGIPCVIGTKLATTKLKDGEIITVNGKIGEIYKGSISLNSSIRSKAEKEIFVNPSSDIKTATKIYINLSEPELAEKMAKLPVEGVGLVRSEFLIGQMGEHPKHMIAQGRQEKFVKYISEAVDEICQNFHPRTVIYRTSDFKTNEYRNLSGGKSFEPEEENPMLGYRGAYRYVHDPEVFELEMAAVKRVREKYKNLWVMIPYVRSPEELLQVKRIMASSGLIRSSNFKLWMSVELPVNVILIEEFIKVGIDGISIGSNDLTMLTIGTDRDNPDVSQAFDTLSPALLWSMERVVRAAKKYNITSSICGQAASTSDTLIEELVKMGVTSVSVNPDAVARVQNTIYREERRLIK